MKKHFYLVLLILPLIYFSAGSHFHINIGLYSVSTSDPEYIYYINALSVANGHFKVGNIDHPGVPLDYFMAASMRVTHFFRADIAPFTEDVLANADWYLQIINLQLILLISGLMYLAGFLMLKIKPNIWYALIIQFFPFANDIVYGNMGRITTENIVCIPVILLSLLILKIYFRKESFSDWKNLIRMVLVIAFGLSIKLTFAPLLAIPFILIGPWKKKMLFGIGVVLTFLIISIPVALQLDYFTGWMKGLFLFSGFYGSGDKTIIKTSEFIPNIIDLYQANKYFFILTFIFAISTAYSFFERKKNQLDNSIFWISMSPILVVLLQMLILGKNYKPSYFVPASTLLPLIIIINIEFFRNWIPDLRFQKTAPLYAGFVIIFLFNSQFIGVKSLSVHFEKRAEQTMKAYYFMKTLDNDCIKILVPGLYGCPTPEYALMSSYGWAGRQKKYYKPVLGKLYPNTFIYYFWDKTFNFWADEPNFKETDKLVYIYMEHGKHREVFEADMKQYFPENYQLEPVFTNEETNEVIFRMNKKAIELPSE